MRFIADLHIHSRYSRATSGEMSPEGLWRWAQIKGISVIGTGDVTHPLWLEELREKLEPAGNGLFCLRKKYRPDTVPGSCRSEVYFLLTAEISCIYRKNDRTRKVHSILLVPGFDDAARINTALSAIGNLRSDGRPILGLDAKRLLQISMDGSPGAMLVPAHAWTPHFSIFGAASGFDSIEECFEELSPQIHAIETGLSSDPAMNWRISALDNITLISNSDAHSPSKIGREANILDTEISYEGILGAIRTRRGFAGTIEFFPEEGKYHNDGHRACGVSMTPEETVRHGGHCPVCGKKVTVGVLHRIDRLADRASGVRPPGALPYHPIIPLAEVVAEALHKGVATKAVDTAYFGLVRELGNEFRILLDTPPDDIERAGSATIAEAVRRMRAGDLHIAPGYDGEYGKVRILEKVEIPCPRGQAPLF
ncbi:MAG: endonuclease Q family protein [Nitrospiraceae bacterium]|nr:endonuclease Q family protein [Nitrospiraceae bacterium]